jgi:hypothetical protein
MDNICKNCAFWHEKKKGTGWCESISGNKNLTAFPYGDKAEFNAESNDEPLWTGQDFGCKHFTAKEQCPNCQHYKNGKCNNEDSMQYNMEVDEKDYCVNFTAEDGAEG